MCISLQQISYIHADKEALFKELNLSVNKGQKIALIGNNGTGKSTLLQIIAGQLNPSAGTVVRPDDLYYIPQHFGQFDLMSIAEALQIDRKLAALHAILDGDVSEINFSILNDDWNIEERAQSALNLWELDGKQLSQPMHTLSGGEKTRVFLAGMEIGSASVILMDEPTNHLDLTGRKRLYDFVRKTSATLLVVSHDRILLNLLNTTCELTNNSITSYGGNYEFYKEQKSIQMNALQQQLEEKEKQIRLAKKTAREMAERKNKQNVRGEKANIKKGIPRIAMNNLKDKAEKSTTRLNDIHARKTGQLMDEQYRIRNSITGMSVLKTNFNTSELHTRKILVTAEAINYSYGERFLWPVPISFQLKSGDRICVEGTNGSGKTTLLKLITGDIVPVTGALVRSEFSYVYLNQDYSIIRDERNVIEQAEEFNIRKLPEHELKMILNRYLFPVSEWDKPCLKLSGGEKMRLTFCCLMLSNNTPDLFILDEPTNNLDIQSVEIITATIRDFSGTIIVVSHDKYFLEEIGIEKYITL